MLRHHSKWRLWIARLLDCEIASSCVLAMTIWCFVFDFWWLEFFVWFLAVLEMTFFRLLESWIVRLFEIFHLLFIALCSLLIACMRFFSRTSIEMTKDKFILYNNLKSVLLFIFMLLTTCFKGLVRFLNRVWFRNDKFCWFVDLLLSCLCDFSVVFYFDFAQYIAFEMTWSYFLIWFTYISLWLEVTIVWLLDL